MLRPKEMVRALIVGPRDLLPQTIDALYGLQALHIVDFEDADETFEMGQPLETASEVSETLLKLRSIAGVLELQTLKIIEREEVGPDAQQKLLTLELNIREEDETRTGIEELLADLNPRIEAIAPFADLGLELSEYSGYENLAVFVGTLPRDLVGLDEITERYEVLRTGAVLALFVEKGHESEVRELLSRLGFVPLEVPGSEGDPRVMLGDLLEEKRKLESTLEEVRGRLTILRQRFASFVVSAEDFFTQEVEKAEAPLRFAASEHSFVAEGWIPKERWEEVSSRLQNLGSLYVDQLESEVEESPVLLDNPEPVRSFELLTQLFSTPHPKEVDPTLALFVILPVFFGMMVGDLGYGIVLAVIGIIGLSKVKRSVDLRRFLAIILVAGIVTAFFGTFIYADAFGIPFHAPEVHHEPGAPVEVSWEMLMGVDIPIEPVLRKLVDVMDLLILSIVAAFLHLGLGFIIGFYNELQHDRRHAAAKAAWFFVLLGLFMIIIFRVQWNRIGGWVWDNVFLWVPAGGLEIFGFTIPWVAFGFLLGGAVIMAVMELVTIGNPVAILEVAGLLANMISYTRLAGLAVAKAHIAESLNVAIFNGLIFDQGILLVAFGIFLLVGAQMIVLLLGGLSSGIQALRLNYVEFFMKFFKGNGMPFKPFGAQATQTV